MSESQDFAFEADFASFDSPTSNNETQFEADFGSFDAPPVVNNVQTSTDEINVGPNIATESSQQKNLGNFGEPNMLNHAENDNTLEPRTTFGNFGVQPKTDDIISTSSEIPIASFGNFGEPININNNSLGDDLVNKSFGNFGVQPKIEEQNTIENRTTDSLGDSNTSFESEFGNFGEPKVISTEFIVEANFDSSTNSSPIESNLDQENIEFGNLQLKEISPVGDTLTENDKNVDHSEFGNFDTPVVGNPLKDDSVVDNFQFNQFETSTTEILNISEDPSLAEDTVISTQFQGNTSLSQENNEEAITSLSEDNENKNTENQETNMSDFGSFEELKTNSTDSDFGTFDEPIVASTDSGFGTPVNNLPQENNENKNDFGTFEEPKTTNNDSDFGSFEEPKTTSNDSDFGSFESSVNNLPQENNEEAITSLSEDNENKNTENQETNRSDFGSFEEPKTSNDSDFGSFEEPINNLPQENNENKNTENQETYTSDFGSFEESKTNSTDSDIGTFEELKDTSNDSDVGSFESPVNNLPQENSEEAITSLSEDSGNLNTENQETNTSDFGSFEEPVNNSPQENNDSDFGSFEEPIVASTDSDFGNFEEPKTSSDFGSFEEPKTTNDSDFGSFESPINNLPQENNENKNNENKNDSNFGSFEEPKDSSNDSNFGSFESPVNNLPQENSEEAITRLSEDSENKNTENQETNTYNFDSFEEPVNNSPQENNDSDFGSFGEPIVASTDSDFGNFEEPKTSSDFGSFEEPKTNPTASNFGSFEEPVNNPPQENSEEAITSLSEENKNTENQETNTSDFGSFEEPKNTGNDSDFGSFEDPKATSDFGFEADFGSFEDPASNESDFGFEADFGSFDAPTIKQTEENDFEADFGNFEGTTSSSNSNFGSFNSNEKGTSTFDGTNIKEASSKLFLAASQVFGQIFPTSFQTPNSENLPKFGDLVQESKKATAHNYGLLNESDQIPVLSWDSSNLKQYFLNSLHLDEIEDSKQNNFVPKEPKEIHSSQNTTESNDIVTEQIQKERKTKSIEPIERKKSEKFKSKFSDFSAPTTDKSLATEIPVFEKPRPKTPEKIDFTVSFDDFEILANTKTDSDNPNSKINTPNILDELGNKNNSKKEQTDTLDLQKLNKYLEGIPDLSFVFSKVLVQKN